MSETNQEDQDRWRELHELLGLSDQPANTAKQAAPPPPPWTPPPAPAVQEPAFATDEVDSRPPAPGRAEDDLSPLPPDDDVMPTPIGSPAADRPARLEEDEDGRQRGRRRGRRGRRSRGGPRDEARPGEPLNDDDTEVEPTGVEDAGYGRPAAARPDEREPRRQPRDRGRPQRDEDEFVEPAHEVKPRPAAAAVDDDDDEPIETFADWNVPSWPEIVASLYRPER